MFKSLASRIKMSSATQSTVVDACSINNPTLSYPLTPTASQETLNLPKISIQQALYKKINDIKFQTERSNYSLETPPFYICDFGELRRQLKLWHQELPFIKPFLAVKCNPNFQFIKEVAKFGNVGFDCASLNEIETVLNAYKELNNPCNVSNNLIYANPVKPISHLKFANSHSVNLTTVDSVEEVEKISKFTDGNMEVLIRITTDDSTAVCPLSVKFGASLAYSTKIVQKCNELGITIRGVAFHCGSGFKDPNTLIKAVSDSKKLWDYINKHQTGANCDILDVGGGFSKENFIEPAKILNSQILTYFGEELGRNNIQIISELGRFLTATCFTLVTNVIGVRNELSSDKVRVYLNDGLYGNLNCILYDHQEVEPLVVTSYGKYVFEDNISDRFTNQKQYSIWGPTCDGLDCIQKKCSLTHHLECGDWIAFKDCGAYTNAAATTFNGFTNDFECIYIDTEI